MSVEIRFLASIRDARDHVDDFLLSPDASVCVVCSFRLDKQDADGFLGFIMRKCVGGVGSSDPAARMVIRI